MTQDLPIALRAAMLTEEYRHDSIGDIVARVKKGGAVFRTKMPVEEMAAVLAGMESYAHDAPRTKRISEKRHAMHMLQAFTGRAAPSGLSHHQKKTVAERGRGNPDAFSRYRKQLNTYHTYLHRHQIVPEPLLTSLVRLESSVTHAINIMFTNLRHDDNE